MKHAAKQKNPDPVIQEYGLLRCSHAGLHTVETQSGVVKARPAAGCLIRPEPGDRVLVCVDPAGDAYILAVLERPRPGRFEIAFDRPVELRVSGGRFSLVCDNGVDLGTSGDISMLSSGLKVHAARGEVNIEQTFFLGVFLQAQLARVKLLAGVLDSVVERLSQKIRRSYRTIEESEHVKAGSLNYVAGKWLSLKGRYALLTAGEDVKVDGERIHIG